MLRAFRKPKIFTTCKSDIKIMKLRLETIKKKRSAVQKYLKNDIADLLRSGLDINAYGRAEGLLVEQNMSACYKLTANFIGCISNNLSHAKLEMLKAKHPTKEMKIQLLRDIAQEFSIEWDSKALEQKLYSPPPPDQGQRRYGSPGDSDDDMHKSHKSKDNAFPKRKNQDAGDVLSHRTEYTASVGSEDETIYYIL